MVYSNNSRNAVYAMESHRLADEEEDRYAKSCDCGYRASYVNANHELMCKNCIKDWLFSEMKGELFYDLTDE